LFNNLHHPLASN